jgi:hypothetical protein
MRLKGIFSGYWTPFDKRTRGFSQPWEFNSSALRCLGPAKFNFPFANSFDKPAESSYDLCSLSSGVVLAEDASQKLRNGYPGLFAVYWSLFRY